MLADFEDNRPATVSCPACGNNHGRVKPGKKGKCSCGNTWEWEAGDIVWAFYVLPEVSN